MSRQALQGTRGGRSVAASLAGTFALGLGLGLAGLVPGARAQDRSSPGGAPPVGSPEGTSPVPSAAAPLDAASAKLARAIHLATTRAARALAAHGQTGWSPLHALALVRAGGPAERATARAMLDRWWARTAGKEPATTYQAALAASAIEGLSLERVDDGEPSLLTRFRARPVAPSERRRLVPLAGSLVAGAVPAPAGLAWGYPLPPVAAGATVERPKKAAPVTWDNSNTQFAVLALHDLARGGVAIPASVLEGIAEHFAKSSAPRPAPESEWTASGQLVPAPPPTAEERDARRWRYVVGGEPTATMTLAALSSLAIARELGAGGPAVDEAIRRGLLAARELLPGIPYAPGEGGRGSAYHYYSLEKALDLLEVDEIDGEPWFPRLAQTLVLNQEHEGLWFEDLDETALYVLFLTRGTIARTRIVEMHATGGARTLANAGEVYVEARKKTVNAVDLVRAYGEASGNKASPAQKEADEAIRALAAEGHGREACLVGPVGALLEKASKTETAGRWLRELTGTTVNLREAASAGERFEDLIEVRDPDLLLQTLAGKGPLPLRAFAAATLAGLQHADAVPALVEALESLADETALASPAGQRCARALGDALLSLGGLDAAPPDGRLEATALHELATRSRQRTDRALDKLLERALAAHAAREADATTWSDARRELVRAGRRGLARLIAWAEDPKKADGAFDVLREVTGERFPPLASTWRVWLEGTHRAPREAGAR